MIRDRLVCRIMDDNTQRHLLAKNGLTFKKVYKTAISMKIAANRVLDIQSGTAHAEMVNKVSDGEKQQKDKRSIKCYCV